MNEMRAMMGRLRIDLVNRDTRAMLDFLDTHPTADARRVGAVGYCMSGPFVFAAATEFPERIAAIASIHGANMVTERADSPHRAAARLRCEAYVACAEVDKWASTADMAVLERELQASGAPFQLEWYPGAQHGFDGDTRNERVFFFPQAQNLSDCLLYIEDDGRTTYARTGETLESAAKAAEVMKRDCMKSGATIASDARVKRQALEDVKAFLKGKLL